MQNAEEQRSQLLAEKREKAVKDSIRVAHAETVFEMKCDKLREESDSRLKNADIARAEFHHTIVEKASKMTAKIANVFEKNDKLTGQRRESLEIKMQKADEQRQAILDEKKVKANKSAQKIKKHRESLEK